MLSGRNKCLSMSDKIFYISLLKHKSVHIFHSLRVLEKMKETLQSFLCLYERNGHRLS